MLRINPVKGLAVRFFAALLMNKSIVLGVAWMERSGVRVV